MGLHHNHSHDHGDHSGHKHSGCPAQGNNNRVRVGIAAVLTGLFMIAEVAGGVISGSLALLADAGHMLTDFAALSLAWAAFGLARRPANQRLTFGYDRFTILAAFVNGLSLFAIAVWIVIEAAQRFKAPGEILPGTMLWVAIAGLAINILVFWILIGADRDNLNIRGAILHVMGDLLGSVAAIIAALIIMRTGWMPIDPLLSVLVALLILKSAWFLIKDSAHILLQGAPDGFDRDRVTDDLLAEIPGLNDVKHMHAWCLTRDRSMMTLEAIIDPAANFETVNAAIKARLNSEFGIDHATVSIVSEKAQSS